MVRLLLDTQIIIISCRTSFRLSETAYKALKSPHNQCYVSLISLWEIAIKRSIGKLPITETMVDRVMNDLAIDELALERKHIRAVSNLPLHHRDPFDRLIIAQALAEDLTIVTADRSFAAYGVPLIAA